MLFQISLVGLLIWIIWNQGRLQNPNHPWPPKYAKASIIWLYEVWNVYFIFSFFLIPRISFLIFLCIFSYFVFHFETRSETQYLVSQWKLPEQIEQGEVRGAGDALKTVAQFKAGRRIISRGCRRVSEAAALRHTPIQLRVCALREVEQAGRDEPNRHSHETWSWEKSLVVPVAVSTPFFQFLFSCFFQIRALTTWNNIQLLAHSARTSH